MYRTHDLVDLVQKGIPEKYRVDVWMVYSGELNLSKYILYLKLLVIVWLK